MYTYINCPFTWCYPESLNVTLLKITHTTPLENFKKDRTTPPLWNDPCGWTRKSGWRLKWTAAAELAKKKCRQVALVLVLAGDGHTSISTGLLSIHGRLSLPRDLILGDDALLYIDDVTLFWAPIVPATRWSYYRPPADSNDCWLQHHLLAGVRGAQISITGLVVSVWSPSYKVSARPPWSAH